MERITVGMRVHYARVPAITGTVTGLFIGVMMNVGYTLYEVRWDGDIRPLRWTCERTGRKGYKRTELEVMP